MDMDRDSEEPDEMEETLREDDMEESGYSAAMTGGFDPKLEHKI